MKSKLEQHRCKTESGKRVGRKREVTHEIGKETASNFLSKLGRDKRALADMSFELIIMGLYLRCKTESGKRVGLRAHCCSLDSSTCDQAATSSSLYEECVHEGCRVEEIDEVC
ncbi:hypothetical protein KUTeg_000178 [Tegillarca granosa]|uniref:Uncharacterized protein n=1 Tax=Tegillarca granosa TaxID=220873 RepID=A0ABQ9FXZ1_TEGGR|nr:hypothetical protein KUTeg_000178 [Tegillarca granosa]